MRQGAGGDQYGIGLELVDEGAVDAGIALDDDARKLHLAGEVGDDAAEFGAARHELRNERLAAEPRPEPS